MKIFLIAVLALTAIVTLTCCKNDSSATSAEPKDKTASAGEEKSNSQPAEASTTAEYHKLTPEEAYQMMLENEDYILLDVRTADEYNEGHIENALLIPDFELSSRAEKELPNKEALILVYCRSGRRSEISAKELVEMDYTNVYDFGGINDWEYEIVTD